MSEAIAASWIGGGLATISLAANLIYNYFKDVRSEEFNQKRLSQEIEFRKQETLRMRRFDLYSEYLHKTWDFATAFPILAAAADHQVMSNWLNIIGEYKTGPMTEIRKTISDISLIASDEISEIVAKLDITLFETNQELLTIQVQNQNDVIAKAKKARELHMKLREEMRKEIQGI